MRTTFLLALLNKRSSSSSCSLTTYSVTAIKITFINHSLKSCQLLKATCVWRLLRCCTALMRHNRNECVTYEHFVGRSKMDVGRRCSVHGAVPSLGLVNWCHLSGSVAAGSQQRFKYHCTQNEWNLSSGNIWWTWTPLCDTWTESIRNPRSFTRLHSLLR